MSSYLNWPDPPDSDDIRQTNQAMSRRREQFRIATRYVADALSNIPAVRKVVLFGSAVRALKKEVPRFRKFRRSGIAVNHECKDVDIAVWVSDLSHLEAIQKARSQALNNLLAEKQIGVAHHQVDIFIMDAENNRYRGRLCIFGSCPKGKIECMAAGCGKTRFLQQHEDFEFESKDLNDETSAVLFERQA